MKFEKADCEMTETKDLKIEEAAFFPRPSAIFKEREEWVEITQGTSRAWVFNGLLVLASAGIMQDGREWLHVSFSRKSRMPSYDDLQLVKREFIGNDKKAIMVFPEQENYVNIHPNCLHLWYSAENPIPEFSESGSI